MKRATLAGGPFAFTKSFGLLLSRSRCRRVEYVEQVEDAHLAIAVGIAVTGRGDHLLEVEFARTVIHRGPGIVLVASLYVHPTHP